MLQRSMSIVRVKPKFFRGTFFLLMLSQRNLATCDGGPRRQNFPNPSSSDFAESFNSINEDHYLRYGQVLIPRGGLMVVGAKKFLEQHTQCRRTFPLHSKRVLFVWIGHWFSRDIPAGRLFLQHLYVGMIIWATTRCSFLGKVRSGNRGCVLAYPKVFLTTSEIWLASDELRLSRNSSQRKVCFTSIWHPSTLRIWILGRAADFSGFIQFSRFPDILYSFDRLAKRRKHFEDGSFGKLSLMLWTSDGLIKWPMFLPSATPAECCPSDQGPVT